MAEIKKINNKLGARAIKKKNPFLNPDGGFDLIDKFPGIDYMPYGQGAMIQNDEEIINKLYSHLTNGFPRLRFEIKIPLKCLFPEPKNRWLKSIWSYGHADISVFRHNKLICILEPGGWYHAKDEKQKIRDSKKDKICRVNGVNCLRIFNNVVNNDLDNLKFRRLLKKYFYG